MAGGREARPFDPTKYAQNLEERDSKICKLEHDVEVCCACKAAVLVYECTAVVFVLVAAVHSYTNNTVVRILIQQQNIRIRVQSCCISIRMY